MSTTKALAQSIKTALIADENLVNGWIRCNSKKFKKTFSKKWINDLNKIICAFISINGRELTAFSNGKQLLKGNELHFYDNIFIKNGATLTISNGCRLFIFCKGTIEINGKFGNNKNSKNGTINMNGKIFGRNKHQNKDEIRNDVKWENEMKDLMDNNNKKTAINYDIEMIKLMKIGGKSGRAPAIQIDGRCGKGIATSSKGGGCLYIITNNLINYGLIQSKGQSLGNGGTIYIHCKNRFVNKGKIITNSVDWQQNKHYGKIVLKLDKTNQKIGKCVPKPILL